MENVMSPEQCRAGRALVGLTQGKLARRADMSPKRIYEIENGRVNNTMFRQTPVGPMLQRILEAAGVEFLFFSNGNPYGVKLRRATASVQDRPMTALHSKVARRWLGWNLDMVGKEAGCSESAARDFEKSRYSSEPATIAKIELTYKLLGLQFLFDQDGKPAGVIVPKGEIADVFDAAA
jgi:transcriptional regulator with XRE-family HTH domain